LATDIQNDQIPFEERVARLMDLGFDRATCEKALSLLPNLDDASALILSGNVSEEGVRALQAELGLDLTESDFYPQLLENPAQLAQLRSGLSLQVQVSLGGQSYGSILITPAQIDAYIRKTYGVGLAEFAPQDPMDPVFARAYARLAQHEVEAIRALVREGFRFPVVVRIFFGCERNLAITRASLLNIFR
jgi:hypothetical protein